MNNGNTQQGPEGQQQLHTYAKKRAEVDLSIDVVILLVSGVFFLLSGLLLFPISTGALSYSKDSLYGLFVILISMQIITMGKTPFGDLLRSWIVMIIGLGTAVLGTLAIFFSGYLTVEIHGLAGLIFLALGILGLLQLYGSEDKARTWMKAPGILRHLTVACSVLNVVEVILGIITLAPGIVSYSLTAVMLVIFGISLFYLAWCIQKINSSYSPEEANRILKRQVSLHVNK
jgi:hypothetical protein